MRNLQKRLVSKIHRKGIVFVLHTYKLLKSVIFYMSIFVICRQKWTSKLERYRFGRVHYSTTRKKLDLSALIKAKKYKSKGNKVAAVAAFKRLQEMELGTLHELGSSRGTPMVNNY